MKTYNLRSALGEEKEANEEGQAVGALVSELGEGAEVEGKKFIPSLVVLNLLALRLLQCS